MSRKHMVRFVGVGLTVTLVTAGILVMPLHRDSQRPIKQGSSVITVSSGERALIVGDLGDWVVEMQSDYPKEFRDAVLSQDDDGGLTVTIYALQPDRILRSARRSNWAKSVQLRTKATPISYEAAVRALKALSEQPDRREIEREIGATITVSSHDARKSVISVGVDRPIDDRAKRKIEDRLGIPVEVDVVPEATINTDVF